MRQQRSVTKTTNSLAVRDRDESGVPEEGSTAVSLPVRICDAFDGSVFIQQIQTRSGDKQITL
jgi:hypothetical protein